MDSYVTILIGTFGVESECVLLQNESPFNNTNILCDWGIDEEICMPTWVITLTTDDGRSGQPSEINLLPPEMRVNHIFTT